MILFLMLGPFSVHSNLVAFHLFLIWNMQYIYIASWMSNTIHNTTACERQLDFISSLFLSGVSCYFNWVQMTVCSVETRFIHSVL